MSWHKYNAKKTQIDGFTFGSIREGKRYQELILLERAGEITDLTIHPRFLLQEGFEDVNPIYYEADFRYTEGDALVVEDVKGHETEGFRLKSKLFRFKYPQYEFRIVR